MQFIIVLLIAGLNTPVYLELYKHALKNKPIWLTILISIAFWGIAVATQTLAAFMAILYLYFWHYRHIRNDEYLDDVDVWHISKGDAARAAVLTLAARAAILAVHMIYIIILVKLVNYNIKLQDIVNYYAEAQVVWKIILALEIVIVAPIVEEFAFRYFLYDKILAPRMPFAVAAVISAALFTTVHFNVAGVPTFFGLGLFCTYLYQKKGYWAAVIAHGVSNLISLLFI